MPFLPSEYAEIIHFMIAIMMMSQLPHPKNGNKQITAHINVTTPQALAIKLNMILIFMFLMLQS